MSSWIPVLLSCAVACAAAPPARAAEPLRWVEVTRRLDGSPRVAEARARARAAAAGVEAAAQVPNPQLEVTGGEGRSQDGLQRRGEWSLSLTVPLDWLGTQGPRVDAARAAAVAAEQDAAGARREAMLQLRRLFVTTAYEQDLAASMTASLAQTEELARLVRRRVESGEGRPTEVPRVEVEVERARSALEQARARAAGLRERLSLWLGEPVDRVEAEASSERDLPPLGEVQARAREDNPLVLAARARVASARSEVQVERNQRIPAVSVGGYVLDELDRQAVGGSVGIQAPIWNWNGGRIEQAESNHLAESSRLEAARIEAVGAATEAWWMCQHGQAAARRYREAIHPRAEQAARTLERSFQLGEASLLDVLDARRVLLEARREGLAAWVERENDCATLHYLFTGDFR